MQLEGEIGKIRETMNTIIKQSHKIVNNFAASMSTLVEKLDKTQQGTLFVDLDVDKDKSQKEDSHPLKRTRANLKRKTDYSIQEIQDLKKVGYEMNILEAKIVETLKSLG